MRLNSILMRHLKKQNKESPKSPFFKGDFLPLEREVRSGCSSASGILELIIHIERTEKDNLMSSNETPVGFKPKNQLR